MPKLLAKGLTAPTKATPKRAVKLAPEGIVTAIVAVTGVTDAVNDLIVPGAFAHTLTVRRPKVVDDHEWGRKAGRVLHVEEWMPGDSRLPKRTKDGKPWPAEAGALVATMQYNLNSEAGRESYEWVRFYAESNEAEFSIGYKVPDGKARRRSDGVRIILMVDLFEFSHVLFGAAPLSMALDVKNSNGVVTRKRPPAPALGATEETDEDYADVNTDPSKPWDDDEDEKKSAAMLVKEAKQPRLERKAAGGADKNRGNAEDLRQYWAHGEGAAKIGWGTPGDFNRCVSLVSEHMTPEDAKGYCNLRHKDALGFYPATHAKMEGKTLEAKAHGRMKGSYEERIAMIQDAAHALLETSVEDLVCVSPVATYDAEVVVTAYPNGEEPRSYLIPYTTTPRGDVDLGEPERVELSLVAEPSQTGVVRTEDDDVETVTVTGPMLETIAAAGALAQVEGKAGQAIREKVAQVFGPLAGKSAEDLPPTETDEDAGPELADPEPGLITAENLPDGDWQEFRKTQPIHAMQMGRDFKVETREGVVDGNSGDWLALDSEGYPYPIAADEMDNVYAAVGDEDDPAEVEPGGDADDFADTEAPAEEVEEEVETKRLPAADEDEVVTLDPDLHFKTMDELDGLADDAEDDPED